MVDAIILSGGLGLRLRPFTNDRPKPMVCVGGKSIAEYQIEWLKRNGVDSVTFACGYKHEKIREYFGDGRGFGVSVSYSVEEYRLGTGGAIKRALGNINTNPVVALNGDVLTDLDLEKMVMWYKRHPFKAVVAAVQLTSPYGILDVREGNDQLYGFREKPVLPNVWINAGIYVLSKEVYAQLPERGDIEQDIFPRLAGYGALGVYRSFDWWTTVDTIKDLKGLEEEIKSRKSLLVSL